MSRVRTPTRLLTPLLVVQAFACTTWRPAPPDTSVMLAERRPPQARVTRSDGERLVMARPIVRVDSIVGSGEGGAIAVALSDVQAVEIPGVHPGAFLMAGFVAAGTALALIFAQEDGDYTAGARPVGIR